MDKVLVIGGSGYVGQAFLAYFATQEIPCLSLSRRQLDYYDPSLLADFLKAEQFTFVVNAAGYTGKPNVDACELHKADCVAGNVVLPGRIREACERVEISWGHVSSGCIYTGRKADGSGFTELDPPNFSFRAGPCSFYSGTKALGEEMLEGARECYIWRLRIPFDHEAGPRNYLSKLMYYDRLLLAENSISHRAEFVRACWQCQEKRVPFGIYNITNPGEVTTLEVVEMLQASGLCDKAFEYFSSELDFMEQAARTPRSNCILDSSKLARAGIQMTEVHQSIEQALATWRE